MDRNGWSTRQLAAELAIAQPDVVRALALLELPRPVQEQVERGSLPPSTAYEISKVEDQAAQTELAARVVAEGLSRQETVAAVHRATGRPTTKAKGKGTTRGRKATFRTKAGLRLTIESRKVLDNESILAALDEVKDQIKDRCTASDQTAA